MPNVCSLAPLRLTSRDTTELNGFSSLRKSIFALLALALVGTPAAIEARPEKERTISFYHIHTKETISLTYKRNGTYLPDALKSINWFMRDWRQNTEIKIDPRAIDILWEMHTELGSKQPIHIICGYRSRKTNNMLRRTRGGQASNSLHITGKAIDAAFPDVPVRYVRYAALIRQRGGVGYYPTSAIPFVHVDTGRVRHWPRMKRDELALLFSNGRSKHMPRGGRRITSRDVARAKVRRHKLATQVAAYHTLRSEPKTPTLLADVGIIKPPKPERAKRPAARPGTRIAALKPMAPKPAAPVSKPRPAPKPWTVEVAPRTQLSLASPTPPPPKPTATFQPRPSDSDRARLNRLIAQATFVPLLEPPRLLRAARSKPLPNAQAPTAETPMSGPPPARTEKPQLIAPPTRVPALSRRFDWAPGMVAVLDDRAWASAPEYDDDHPDELAYRPFPIEPLMTASLDDPTLSRMLKPDNAKTLELLDHAGTIPRMRLRPPQQVAQLMWRQEFSGAAVQIHGARPDGEGTAGLSSRRVAKSTE